MKSEPKEGKRIGYGKIVLQISYADFKQMYEINYS
jgi:hypothetical protein